MNWATAAAFTAAFLSLVNVGYSDKLTSHSSREQWRRDQERPVVAKCLALSRQAARSWFLVSAIRQLMKPGENWDDSEGKDTSHAVPTR
jgi:hypothetical protein